MKKKIAFAASVLMIASAFTAEANAEDNRNAVITTQIDPAYIVTIPTDLNVPFNSVNTDFGAVQLESAQVEPNKCVKVTLISDNALENTADPSKTIPYTVCEGTADNVGGVYTSAKYLVRGDKTDLTVSITQDDWNNAYAGEYTDTVTFQIEYADK